MSRIGRPALIIISLAIAFITDIFTFRDYPIAPLYIIPILIAAYWYSPRVVAVVAGSALVFMLVSASFQPVARAIAVYYFLSLAAASLVVLRLAVMLAAGRASAERRGQQGEGIGRS